MGRTPKPRKAREKKQVWNDDSIDDEEEEFDEEEERPTKKKKKPAAPESEASSRQKDSDGEKVRESIVRAERVELEDVLKKLWAAGKFDYNDLVKAGLKEPPQKLAKGVAAASARLSSTGTMGFMEPLSHETLQSMFQYVGTKDRFVLSEVCRGLLSLRGQARSWEDVDFSQLTGATGRGLSKCAGLMDTTRTRTLHLSRTGSGYTAKSKDPIKADDWIRVISKLQCTETLETLHLQSKRFADGTKTLAAMERLVKNLKTLIFDDIKALDHLVKLLRKAPKLTSLVVEGNVSIFELGNRIAQLAKIHRGDGARSLITELRNTNWWTFTSATPTNEVFEAFSSQFPELQILQAPKVIVFSDVVTPPPNKTSFNRLRILALSEVTFCDPRFWPVRTPSPTAVTKLMQSLSHCPVLEACSIQRDVEWLSQKDLASGRRYVPAPLVSNLHGLTFPQLRVLALYSFQYDTTSFAGLDAPHLKHLDLTRHSKYNLIGDDFPRDRTAFEQVIRTAADGNDVNVVYSDHAPKFPSLRAKHAAYSSS